ncbi:MAG TPA: DUF3151 family protein [Ilumatobacteraceae bacterium]|nr:DUF3151 family protein [Ilumatobacteraceae bacterium]HRB03244.1 DUF3151 family protein [Ilumatobacteraceae bacterium]
MSDQPILLTPQGPPRTVLPVETAAVRHAVQQVLAAPAAGRRNLAAAIVAGNPRSLIGWCTLGDVATDTIEKYAAYRVGYHRGLDTLRANGWRGSGYVRWADETNRPFLGCLRGLGAMADAIGETDEAERIALFLAQLDPSLGSA